MSAGLIEIRSVREHEWRTWRELRLRALADAPEAFGEQHAEVTTRDEAHWVAAVAPRRDAIRLVGFADDRPAGMLVVALDPDDARCAHLYAMWVAPEARRIGIGTALIRHGLAWSRGLAALDVSLRVSERQAEARRMYLRNGFQATGGRTWLRPGSPIACEVLAQRLPPLVMGVVNVTPDSFSDGGSYLDPAAAIARGRQLRAEGADILDVGGEATNPRARPVTAEEELRRVLPVAGALAADGATVSVDTTKAAVARAALDAGASIINDVSGGLFDAEMAGVMVDREGIYLAGHLRGRSLAEVFAAEGNVTWHDVARELAARLRALPAGTHAWIDPGIGFGKGADPEGNVALVRHAGDIAATVRRPVVVGVSRKRFLRRLLGVEAPGNDVLDAASVLASLAAVRAGAQVLRVHNVTLLKTALTQYNK